MHSSGRPSNITLAFVGDQGSSLFQFDRNLLPVTKTSVRNFHRHDSKSKERLRIKILSNAAAADGSTTDGDGKKKRFK